MALSGMNSAQGEANEVSRTYIADGIHCQSLSFFGMNPAMFGRAKNIKENAIRYTIKT